MLYDRLLPRRAAKIDPKLGMPYVAPMLTGLAVAVLATSCRSASLPAAAWPCRDGNKAYAFSPAGENR
jgi:hypothetical protein